MILNTVMSFLQLPIMQVSLSFIAFGGGLLLLSWCYGKLTPESRKKLESILLTVSIVLFKINPLISRTVDLERYSKSSGEKLIIRSDSDDSPQEKNLKYYSDLEFNHTKNIRVAFTNLFVIFTFAVIIAFIFLDKLTLEVRVTLGFVYLSFSLFVLFIIKSCYRRSAVILAIIEDIDKKESIKSFFKDYKKNAPLNESDIEFLKLLSLSRAEREKSTNHPYEIFLKNVSGSSVSFGKGDVKIGENSSKESKAK